MTISEKMCDTYGHVIGPINIYQSIKLQKIEHD